MSLHVFACAACGHKVYPARLWCPACGHAQAEPVAVESGELLAWTSIPDGEGGLRLLATVRARCRKGPDLIIRLPPELAESCAPASGWRCRRGVRTASMRLGAGRPDPSGRPPRVLLSSASRSRCSPHEQTELVDF